MKKILALTGSVKGIKTAVALNQVISLIDTHYPEFQTEFLAIGDFNLEFSDGRPITQYNLDTQKVINAIMAADAIIIASPTYQTSIPGALKNIFDLLPVDALKEKVAAMIITASSPMYFMMAEQQLKPILSYMGAHVISKYVYIQDCHFDTHNTIVNEDILKRLEDLSFDVADALSHMDHHKLLKRQRKS